MDFNINVPKWYIIRKSLFENYDGNINTNALQFYTGLQNTLEIMSNSAEN